MQLPLIGITTSRVTEPSLRSTAGQRYIDAIGSAGGAPILIPLGLNRNTLRSVYERLDGLLLPGGEDVASEEYGENPHPMLGKVSPERDELELVVATWALEDGIPVLGICRGIQLLAVAAGGTLYQDVPAQLPEARVHSVTEFGRDHLCHEVIIEPGTVLAKAVRAPVVQVNSFHHQAVKAVPAGFRVSAHSSDGIIEGIESETLPFVVGVQCHPEEIWNCTAPQFAGLFTAFVDAARNRLMTDRRQIVPSAAVSA